MGRRAGGPGCLQIWEVRCRGGGELVQLPRMALGICHDGGVGHDAKWCPSGAGAEGHAAQQPDSLPRSVALECLRSLNPM